MARNSSQRSVHGFPSSDNSQSSRSFGRHAFLATFAAVCGVAVVTFTGVQIAERRETRTRVVQWLRESQHTVDQACASRNLDNSRDLAAVATDRELLAAVSSAVRPHQSNRAFRGARLIVRKHMLAALAMTGGEAAAIVAANGQTSVAEPPQAPANQILDGSSRAVGIRDLSGTLYTMAAAPLGSGGRVVATLWVARRFDFAGLAGDDQGAAGAIFFRHGRLDRSTISPQLYPQIAGLPAHCIQVGCEFRLGDEDGLAFPLSDAAVAAAPGSDDRVVVFRSIDGVVDRLTEGWCARLPALGIAVALLALLFAAPVSHALTRPLHQLIARLEFSEAAGRWEADFPEDSASWEVNQLAAAINRAASAVAHSNQRLDQVSIEFVEAMAQALDAGNPRTAGHGKRVSDYAIASAMKLPPGEIETIRLATVRALAGSYMMGMLSGVTPLDSAISPLV